MSTALLDTTSEDQEDLIAEGEAETTVDAQEAEDKELRKYMRGVSWRNFLSRRLDDFIDIGSTVTVALGVLLVVLGVIAPSLGLAGTMIVTGSMAGTIEVGDIALTQRHDPLGTPLQVGQIILIEHEDGGRFLHRIAEVNTDGTYTTRGDANDLNDLFKPTNADVTEVYFNHISQPLAGFMNFFRWDFEWFPTLTAAVQAGEWASAGPLLAAAPWGYPLFILSVLLFWFVLPRVLRKRIEKIEDKDAVELKRVSLRVEEQQETISDHDESIKVVVPIVEEIVQERETAKADDEAAKAELETMWGNWDPTASINDEPEEDEQPEEQQQPAEIALPFPTVGPTEFTGKPSPMRDFHARFNPVEPADSDIFALQLAARRGAPLAPSSDGLDDELPPLESTPVSRPRLSRLASSAINFEEK
jgi:signal peptidase I